MSASKLNTGLALFMALAFIGALTVGPAGLGLREVLSVFTGGGSEGTRIIIIEVRLPRAILAALIGAALGLAGAVLQGYLRNPLAEPGLIGVSPQALSAP